MIKTVFHLGDLHIPNSIDQYEVKQKNLCKAIIKQAKKYGQDGLRIVIVGDIFEGKVKASNEAKKMFHSLLNVLNNICTTYIVAGNHDMLQNNHNKLDSIAPTFEIENVYPNVHYLDKDLGYKSGCIIDENVIWALYSMHDNFAKPNIESVRKKNQESTVIGLYHGDTPGSTTDIGFMSDSGLPGEAFVGCECVMAGHIHKRQELRREGIPLVYSGSVFQKDFGENTTGHGFEVWDMETLEHKHIEVENPYGMYKFRIESYDDVKNDVEKLLNL